MRVVQPGDDGTLVQVDQLGALVTEAHDLAVAADREKPAVTNRRRLYERAAFVLSRNLAVMKDQIRRLFVHHRASSVTCEPFRVAGPRTPERYWAVRRAPWCRRIPRRCHKLRNGSLPDP